MSDFVNFKDEVLSGNPQYYVGNDSAPKQISLATPVTESGTQLNKTFFNLFNNVLGYEEAEYEESTSEGLLIGNLIVGRELNMINNERLLIQTPNYDYLSLDKLKVNNINCDMLFPNSKYEIIYNSEENKFVKVENQMSWITGTVPSRGSITLDVVPKFIIGGSSSASFSSEYTNLLNLNYKTISNSAPSSIYFIAYF